jgi:hypothetical protein
VKICSRCGQKKPLSEFNRRSSSPDGHRPECRDCQHKDYRRYYHEGGGRENAARYYFENKAQLQVRWREYARTRRGKAAILRAARNRGYDPVKAAAYRAVHRAIANGILTRPIECDLCGAPGPTEAHHHNGYEREHHLDVIFLCRECHDIADHGLVVPLRGEFQSTSQDRIAA